MMHKRTKDLLAIMLPNKKDQTKWLNGYNTRFGMSPQEFIDAGEEQDVMEYLEWAVYGPY